MYGFTSCVHKGFKVLQLLFLRLYISKGSDGRGTARLHNMCIIRHTSCALPCADHRGHLRAVHGMPRFLEFPFF